MKQTALVWAAGLLLQVKSTFRFQEKKSLISHHFKHQFKVSVSRSGPKLAILVFVRRVCGAGIKNFSKVGHLLLVCLKCWKMFSNASFYPLMKLLN